MKRHFAGAAISGLIAMDVCALARLIGAPIPAAMVIGVFASFVWADFDTGPPFLLRSVRCFDAWRAARAAMREKRGGRAPQ